MSKKESEFERYDRMKKFERETEVLKRKSFYEEEDEGKTVAKIRTNSGSKKGRGKGYEKVLEEEFAY